MERHGDNRISPGLISLCFAHILFFTNPFVSTAESLTHAERLKIGKKLVSDSRTFQLGFSTKIADDNNCYLGIWYGSEDSNAAEPVWVANRDSPIPDGSAMLTIDDKGSLIIKYGEGKSLPLYSVEKATTTVATLEDNGNFVLRDNATTRVLWQSFDRPTDTLLPGMKLGFNRRTGQNWSLTSWRSRGWPSSGFYSLGIDPKNPKELIIWWHGDIYWRSGAWLKERGTFGNANFTPTFAVQDNNSSLLNYNFLYNSSADEVYFTYSVHKNASANTRRNQETPKLFITYARVLYNGNYQSLVSCSIFSSETTWDSGCYKKHVRHCEDRPNLIDWTVTGYNGFMSANGLKKEKDCKDISNNECRAMCWRNCTCIAFSTNPCEFWSQGTHFTSSNDPRARIIYFFDKVEETGPLLLQGHDLKNEGKLLSDSQNFTLQFFGSKNKGWYLGIWYALDNIKPVWVANRNDPIFSDSVLLTIDDKGSLVIKYGHGKFLTLYSAENYMSTYASLEDNGNFVLRRTYDYDDDALWQSFDQPTDTLLPEMKLGFSRAKRQNWSLNSWRTGNLPAIGSFAMGIDPNYPNELAIWWRGSIHWRSGAWQQEQDTFNHTSSASDFVKDYKIIYSSSRDEVYFSFSLEDKVASSPKLPRLTITPSGELNFGQRQSWVTCSIKKNTMQRSSGCEKQPECRNSGLHEDIGIMSAKGIKVEESKNITSSDCEAICWKNCSCIAYSNAPSCEIWIKGTFFTSTVNDPRAQRIILVDKFEGIEKMTSWMISLIAIGVLGLLIFCYAFYVILKKIKIEVERIIKRITLIREIGGRTVVSTLYEMTIGQTQEHNLDNEIQIFSFRSIVIATKNFSVANKLGHGGFGSVYKGKLADGQEIAIKRLSERSGQGLEEFKNEAILMARLQHTNLVRIMGYCIERDERILVYEYMSKKSLDYYIFDSERKKMLNWRRKFNIIEGVAQGLIYLHMYSRLTVIHHDLKASNILLDNDMNPKISDFGMARIFQQRGVEVTTNRIGGTHGYMSPEYVRNGIVSLKTDVFSFGVLILEIAWQLWNEDKVMELIDRSFLDRCPTHEALRCVHLGLLCVQDRAPNRPTMLEVVSMLSNTTALLPTPRRPAFYIEEEEDESNGSKQKQNAFSINEMSITVTDGR